MNKTIATQALPIPDQGILPRPARRILSAYAKKSVHASNLVRVHRFDTSDGGVVIVTIVCDDSWSADDYRDALHRGINAALARLKSQIPRGAIVTLKAMKAETPWVCCVPLVALDLPVRLEYQQRGKTPLWRATLEALALAIALCQELAAKGIRATSTTIVATDAYGDTMPSGLSADKVARVVCAMRERRHVIQGMGVGDPVAYSAILQAMGILEEDIFDASSAHQIDAALTQFVELAQARCLALTAG